MNNGLKAMLESVINEALQPIKDDIRSLKEDVQSLKGDVQILKKDVQSLKGDVQVLKGDVQTLKTGVQKLESDVQTLKSGQSELLQLARAIYDRQEETDARLKALTMDVLRATGDITSLKQVQSRQEKIMGTLALRSL